MLSLSSKKSLQRSKFIQTGHIILGMALVKLVIHLFANNIYGLHRDEYLYFAEGQHLGWGYMEGPPMIALLAWFANIFGGSPFVIRLIPTLIGVMSVVLIGNLVRDLGGKKWAIFIACLAFIISPAFLRSNMLFQPVSLNQFFWLLSAFWMVRIVKFKDNRDWYWLGVTIGLGLMTKYSILFFVTAMLIASLFTKHKTWYRTKYPYITAAIACVIFLPNLLWQWHHHFPVIDHMRELSETQLVHVNTVQFFVDQFQNQLAASLIWVPGLFNVLFAKRMSDFRMFGLGYIILLAMIYILGGKTYYTLGIYPMLFVFGGLAIEDVIQRDWIRWILVGVMVVANTIFSPYALPFLPVETMQKYCTYMRDKIGLEGPLRWEDGTTRQLPQDYADMFGWEEIAENVGKVYHALPDSIRQSCNIFGGGYGHAGAINFYRKKYNLPEAHSMNASFLIWAPKEIEFTNQIMVNDRKQNSSDWFQNMTLVDSVRNIHARDPGYIYYRSVPKRDLKEAWKENVEQFKSRYGF